MRIQEKQQIVEDLRDRFSKSAIIVLTDYKGLDVAAMNDLRRRLRAEEIEYRVVKNTILIRASADNDGDLIKDFFKGPSAVALGFNDPIAPAKVLAQFAKDHKQLEIKVGVMGGKVLDVTAITALAKLPAREVLLGQFLAALNAIPTSLVRTLAAVPRSFVNVLAAIKDQKEAA